MGDHQRAFESFQAHLTLLLRSNPKAKDPLCKAICNLGKYHILNGEFSRALPLFKLILESEELTGKSRRTEAKALHHLGEQQLTSAATTTTTTTTTELQTIDNNKQ